MGLKEQNRNGGYNRDNTGIIIMWKMKKDAGIGCFDWDIMMMRISSGLYMGIVREIGRQVARKSEVRENIPIDGFIY